MKRWSFLEPGDLIEVVAPGSGTPLALVENVERGLINLGFRVRISNEIVRGDHPYLSQSDKFRTKDLKRALVAKDSRAIWCLRGGYGALRLLPELNLIRAPKEPKVFLGYSDITSLHLFLNQKWKWNTLHGPLLDRLGEGTFSPAELNEVLDTLTGRVQELEYEGLTPMNSYARKCRSIEASISGGNLVVLQSSLGTPWQYRPRGIAFFEEVGERGYRLDRLLVHMEQAGVFERAQAVVFGHILGGDEKDGRNFTKYAIEDFVARAKIPVFSSLSAGHGQPNRIVPFGSKALLTGGEKSRLVVSTGGKL